MTQSPSDLKFNSLPQVKGLTLKGYTIYRLATYVFP